MYEKREVEFHYSHYMPEKPPMVLEAWREREAKCSACGVEYRQRSPNTHRCTECQGEAKRRQQDRAAKKLKAQRDAAKQASVVRAHDAGEVANGC